MGNLILYAAFLSAVAGYQNGPGFRGTNLPHSMPLSSSSSSSSSSTPSTSEPSSSSFSDKFDGTTTTTTMTTITSTTPKAPTTTTTEKHMESTTVNLLTEVLSELPSAIASDDSKHRFITYDQRQEGQYNIRADLENFMIILIPPSPADGLNLLDLLTKATYRRNAQATSKGKKKHYMSSTSIQPEAMRLQHGIKSGGVQNINFLTPNDNDNSAADLRSQSNENSNSNSDIVGEYIEGRTPYQVDISSTVNGEDTAQARMQSDRQVDVLPPPYPLAYQQLMKPYHLEAESTLIQALPPAELTQKKQTAGNYLEAFNQIVTPKTASDMNDNINKNFLIPPADTSNNIKSPGNYFRLARAIRGDNTFLDTNRVTSGNSASSTLPSIYGDRFMLNRHTHTLPIYRADLSLGAAQLYPPLDIPHYSSYVTLNARNRQAIVKPLNDDDSFERNDRNRQSLNGSDLNDRNNPSNLDEEFEMDLHNGEADVSLIDSEAKSLLSDGIERCAPGKRRDSYGVCRQIGDGY